MADHFQREPDGYAFGGSPQDYKDRCYTFLITLCNDKDMVRAARYLDPECVLTHEDNPPVRGAEAFIRTWSQLLGKMPEYHKDIQSMVVEMDSERPSVARVWVYSRITGISTSVRDSIDMMHFSADGLFLDSKDVQRETKAQN